MTLDYSQMDAYGLIKAMPIPIRRMPQDRTVNIPGQVQRAMDQHLQQNMPANLKYYQNSGGYVPPAIQKQMAAHMQKTMPTHLQQYINPYMQQRVVNQHLDPSRSFQQPHHSSPANITTITHDKPVTVLTENKPLGTSQTPAESVPEQPISNAQPPVTPGNAYEFITEAPPEVRNRFSLLTGKSLPIRIAIISGGLLALFILLTIGKGLLGGGLNPQPYITVMEDQQELIHLATNAQQASSSSGLTVLDQNFIANSLATFSSDQAQIEHYLLSNKQKYTLKELNLKVSTSLDSQLTTALTAGSYATLLRQTMNSKLTSYAGDLNSAYKASSGKIGRALLSSEYDHTALLYKQLAAIQ